VFGGGQAPANFTLKLSDSAIPLVEKVKYLGNYVFVSHVQNIA